MKDFRILVRNREHALDPTEIQFSFVLLSGQDITILWTMDGFSHNYKEEIRTLLKECEAALDKPFIEEKRRVEIAKIKYNIVGKIK